MLLSGKHAIVYGAAGSVGQAISQALAKNGATLHLTGRTAATLEEVADSIRAAGGTASAARVDARDAQSVAHHAANVVAETGSIDISVNAISLDEVQGIPLVELTLEDYMTPIVAAAEAHFLTARTAAKQMISQGSGVIVLMSSSAAKETRHHIWEGSASPAPALKRAPGAWREKSADMASA